MVRSKDAARIDEQYELLGVFPSTGKSPRFRRDIGGARAYTVSQRCLEEDAARRDRRGGQLSRQK